METTVPPGEGRSHLLTVVVEDYYHHAGFRHVVHPERWRRFEARVERDTLRALDLLDGHRTRATFFVLGWVADRVPDLIAEVARRGHEVACRGYNPRTLQEMGPEGLRDEVRRGRDALERAACVPVHGFRVARGSLLPRDLWVLDLLADEGFRYDSSIYPRLGWFAREPWRRFPHVHRHGEAVLTEMPLTSVGPAWMSVPLAGGNYFRQFPPAIVRAAVATRANRDDAPLNLYFHVWELDPDLPRIESLGWFTRLRQYRNLDRMPSILESYLRDYRFQPIAARLGLPFAPVGVPPSAETRHAPVRQWPGTEPAGDRPAATLVVPVFNEELAIPYLANTLAEVHEDIGQKYDLSYVFVDDGSRDRTWESLEKHFGGSPRCRLVRLPRNQGVARAILAGIREASTEVVASIDCDCTYDPRQLAAMIPMLEDGVAMVTASPYHARGRVVGVPGWRLGLSKGLSALYRCLLRNRLATYTACFRVYRRSKVADLEVREGGFLGVTEMLGLLDLAGEKVAEYPAVLEVRVLGYSKMKVARTIAGHLRLLARLALARRRAKAA